MHLGAFLCQCHPKYELFSPFKTLCRVQRKHQIHSQPPISTTHTPKSPLPRATKPHPISTTPLLNLSQKPLPRRKNPKLFINPFTPYYISRPCAMLCSKKSTFFVIFFLVYLVGNVKVLTFALAFGKEHGSRL